jgi:hypothetical protein
MLIGILIPGLALAGRFIPMPFIMHRLVGKIYRKQNMMFIKLMSVELTNHFYFIFIYHPFGIYLQIFFAIIMLAFQD